MATPSSNPDPNAQNANPANINDGNKFTKDFNKNIEADKSLFQKSNTKLDSSFFKKETDKLQQEEDTKSLGDNLTKDHFDQTDSSGRTTQQAKRPEQVSKPSEPIVTRKGTAKVDETTTTSVRRVEDAFAVQEKQRPDNNTQTNALANSSYINDPVYQKNTSPNNKEWKDTEGLTTDSVNNSLANPTNNIDFSKNNNIILQNNNSETDNSGDKANSFNNFANQSSSINNFNKFSSNNPLTNDANNFAKSLNKNFQLPSQSNTPTTNSLEEQESNNSESSSGQPEEQTLQRPQSTEQKLQKDYDNKLARDAENKEYSTLDNRDQSKRLDAREARVERAKAAKKLEEEKRKKELEKQAEENRKAKEEDRDPKNVNKKGKLRQLAENYGKAATKINDTRSSANDVIAGARDPAGMAAAVIKRKANELKIRIAKQIAGNLFRTILSMLLPLLMQLLVVLMGLLFIFMIIMALVGVNDQLKNVYGDTSVTPESCQRSTIEIADAFIRAGGGEGNNKVGSTLYQKPKQDENITKQGVDYYMDYTTTVVEAFINLVNTGRIDSQQSDYPLGYRLINEQTGDLIREYLKKDYATTTGQKDPNGNDITVTKSNVTGYDFGDTNVEVSGLKAGVDGNLGVKIGLFKSSGISNETKVADISGEARNNLHESWQDTTGKQTTAPSTKGNDPKNTGAPAKPGDDSFNVIFNQADVLVDNSFGSKKSVRLGITPTVRVCLGPLIGCIDVGAAIQSFIKTDLNIGVDIQQRTYTDTFYKLENLRRKAMTTMNTFQFNEEESQKVTTYNAFKFPSSIDENAFQEGIKNISGGFTTATASSNNTTGPASDAERRSYGQSVFPIIEQFKTNPTNTDAINKVASLKQSIATSYPRTTNGVSNANIALDAVYLTGSFPPGNAAIFSPNDLPGLQIVKAADSSLENNDFIKGLQKFKDALLGQAVTQQSEPIYFTKGDDYKNILAQFTRDIKSSTGPIRRTSGIEGKIIGAIGVDLFAFPPFVSPSFSLQEIAIKSANKTISGGPNGAEYVKLLNSVSIAVLRASGDDRWYRANQVERKDSPIHFAESDKLGLNGQEAIALNLEQHLADCAAGRWTTDIAQNGIYSSLANGGSCKSWESLSAGDKKRLYNNFNVESRDDYIDSVIAADLETRGFGLTDTNNNGGDISQRDRKKQIIAYLLATARFDTGNYQTAYYTTGQSGDKLIVPKKDESVIGPGFYEIQPEYYPSLALSPEGIAAALESQVKSLIRGVGDVAKDQKKFLASLSSLAETYGGIGSAILNLKLSALGVGVKTLTDIANAFNIPIVDVDIETDILGVLLLAEKNNINQAFKSDDTYIEALRPNKSTGVVYYGRGLGMAGARGEGIYKKIQSWLPKEDGTPVFDILKRPQRLADNLALSSWVFVSGATHTGTGTSGFTPFALDVENTNWDLIKETTSKTSNGTTKSIETGKIDVVKARATTATLSPDHLAQLLKGDESYVHSVGVPNTPGNQGIVGADRLRELYKEMQNKVSEEWVQKVQGICNPDTEFHDPFANEPDNLAPCIFTDFNFLPTKGDRYRHTGFDFDENITGKTIDKTHEAKFSTKATPENDTAIFPVMSGTIVVADMDTSQSELWGGGNFVVIDNRQGTKITRTRYLHLKPIRLEGIEAGKSIKAGQQLGWLGGTSSDPNMGAHSHIDMVVSYDSGITWDLVNPAKYIRTNYVGVGANKSKGYSKCADVTLVPNAEYNYGSFGPTRAKIKESFKSY
jgi:Peptidase family M23